MFSKKEFAIVSNLKFISKTNFMLSWVEHEKRFITSGLNKAEGLYVKFVPDLRRSHIYKIHNNKINFLKFKIGRKSHRKQG